MFGYEYSFAVPDDTSVNLGSKKQQFIPDHGDYSPVVFPPENCWLEQSTELHSDAQP